MEKEIREDAKLKNLSKEDLDVLWNFRYPEDTADKLKYAEIQGEVPLRWGFTVALSTLSGFYKWLRQKRETADAIERAEQAKYEYLEQNPDASPESLMALGQMVFANKAMQSGDLSGYVQLASLMERRKAREFNEKKFQEAMKSKLDAGLDALYEEIQGNKKAEVIFANLKKVLES